MQTINLYLYSNVIEFQFLDPTIFKTRKRVVYNRTIKVYQGIDNPVLIVIKNQDQKAVDLSGYAVQVDIQDPINRVTVNSYAVNFSNIDLGRGSIMFDRETINSLDQRLYELTAKKILLSDLSETPFYIDDNYGIPVNLEVLPAYYADSEPGPFVDNSVIDGGII